MGKKQHQKDKMYLTTTEWKELYGGHKDSEFFYYIFIMKLSKYIKLKFFKRVWPSFSGFHLVIVVRCNFSVSLQPCDVPYCCLDGYIFDLIHILPFVRKFGKHPVTGNPLDVKSLIKLDLKKNSEGQYVCPITKKVFTDNSHVVMVRPTGIVYSYEAVEELNFKTKHFKDLITDEPFVKADIITLQDPYKLEKFNISKFYHVKNKLKVKEDVFILQNKNSLAHGGKVEELPQDDPLYKLKSINTETRETLSQLQKDYKAPEKQELPSTSKADALNAAHYSTGMVAAGFTSTVMEPVTEQQPAVLDEDILKYRRVKSMGYVRLVTNKGLLNLELYCEKVPRACENFIVHCRNGYYKQTKFHRLIRNFMVQGGDPTGTGTGGESIWGKPFRDEFVSLYSHSGRGVLSMANRGKHTNTSQFFITFRSCKQLDKKHTIFGRVVGGLDTLEIIEAIETDNNDRPVEDIVILDTVVFVNPFEKAEEQLKAERKAALEQSGKEEKKVVMFEKKSAEKKIFRSGVGKYIDLKAVAKSNDQSDDEEQPLNSITVAKKKKVIRTELSDFSQW
ncbi:Peptidyl-prolyl cis-trans isomerase 4 [Trichinella murrelli]|uniref:RING-type E3 ubiquitin transferase n=1 Tax=Trichinella murrelli TaxID=144512 RepID=A0A0V0UHW2_9BILA|nr:Peptidyl-prolyl cis-trans isomerase 4 [Trichinella murrelli]